MNNRTPFYNCHLRAGAKMTDFGGYKMPMQYDGIKKEHNAVRQAAGLFDVSHMGEFLLDGEGATDLLQKLTVSDMAALPVGQAAYTVMCREDGGILEDLIAYREGPEMWMLVVNAANRKADLEWILSHNHTGVEVVDLSEEIALLALQGPMATSILEMSTEGPVSDLKRFEFRPQRVAGQEGVLVSATGYTGEEGFELYIQTTLADPIAIWESIVQSESREGAVLCGLGARDTLRLEAGMLLCGQDMGQEVNPYEARLSWLVHPEKGDFIGRESLEWVRNSGPEKMLCGMMMTAPGKIPRTGYDIADRDGAVLGRVTSGTHSITLKQGIALGYLPAERATVEETIYISIRGELSEAKIVKLPFV
ncbi:MAG: glycine cleavage system aminomethyltransferase GcvT [Balneolaceae bacterium]